MKKGYTRFITVIMIICILFINVVAFATGVNIEPKESATSKKLLEIAQVFLGYIQWIGLAIALGMLIFIGIRYTMSAANTRADMKGALVKFIIGAIVIAAAPAIANAVVSIISGSME